LWFDLFLIDHTGYPQQDDRTQNSRNDSANHAFAKKVAEKPSADNTAVDNEKIIQV